MQIWRTNVDSDTLRLMGSRAKSRRKVVERISCLTKGVCTIGLWSQDYHPRKPFLRKGKIGIKSHCQILQGHVAPHQNSGKSIARSYSKVRTSRAQSVRRQVLRRGHTTKPCNNKDAPAEAHETWKKVSPSLKKGIRLHSAVLSKHG